MLRRKALAQERPFTSIYVWAAVEIMAFNRKLGAEAEKDALALTLENVYLATDGVWR